MIRQPSGFYSRREWRRAVVLSIALHLLGVGGLFWLGRQAGSAESGVRVLDTLVVEGPAVSVLLMDERPPVAPRPLPPQVTQSLPELPLPVPTPPMPEPTGVVQAALPTPVATANQHEPSRPPPSAAQTGISQAQAGAGPRGSAAGASFFALSAPRAQRIVYVIDCSASMGQHGHLDRARQELLVSLDTLPPTAAFQIVIYNGYAEPLRLGGRTGLVAATPAIKLEVAQRLEQLRAAGRTDHLQALRCALELEPEVIFFLTDAGDMKPEEIRRIGLLNQGRAAIHCIELRRGRPLGDSPLSQLARGNRGLYQPVVP